MSVGGGEGLGPPPPRLTWDEGKRRVNVEKHGVDFADVAWFDWSRARIFEDRRLSYGENRFIAFGPIRERSHVVVYTLRADLIRIISVRKANPREIRAYGDETDPVDG
jgi:uncharacterized DUF497 family protein